MKLSVKWVKHCKTQEQKKEVMAQVLAAKPALSLITKIITEELELLRKKKVGKDLYSNPNWAYCQADAVGEERALRSILKLLSIKEEG